MASFAAILAIGKPVALDASAEDRLTRGFISMTVIRPERGSNSERCSRPIKVRNRRRPSWTSFWMLPSISSSDSTRV